MADASPYTSGWKSLKKGDLIDLADKLGISVDTSNLKRLDIIGVIQKYLDENERTLTDNPIFRGLYPKRSSANRRGSAIPAQTEESDEISEPVPALAPVIRKGAGKLPPRSVSPTESGDAGKASLVHAANTPSRIPLPPSPIKLIQDISVRVRPELDAVLANATRTKDQLGIETDKILAKTKLFLSDSLNLASITVLWELLFLVATFTPIEYTPFQLGSPGSEDHYTINLPHPPVTLAFWEALFILLAKWSLPTLIIPQMTGRVVNFRDGRDIDPLTASIARLVCVLSIPWGIPEELLSVKSRILAASTALAFAIAEALNDRKDEAEVVNALVPRS